MPPHWKMHLGRHVELPISRLAMTSSRPIIYTDFLHNRLCTEIVSPQPKAAQRYADNKSSDRCHRVVRIRAKAVTEKKAESKRQTDHLPTKAPDPTTNWAHVEHEARRRPGSAKLDDGATRSGDADMDRVVADGHEKGNELPRERQYSEIQK